VDVTSEGAAYWLRRDAFVGLQPMAWHYHGIDAVPAELYRGTPMQAEAQIRVHSELLLELAEQFCLKVTPWHYANNRTRPKGPQQIIDSDNACVPALWADRALVAYSRKG